MYSPKIKTDLIPILYCLAKEKEKPMTHIVDEIIRPALVKYEQQKAIPYCVNCYSEVETKGKEITAYCEQCKSERFVLYCLSLENLTYKRKEVI